jgi:hypothetical protein
LGIPWLLAGLQEQGIVWIRVVLDKHQKFSGKGGMEMELKAAKAMVKRINKKEGEEVAYLHENYYGRFMFGKKTTGVVAPSWALPNSKKYSIDNMGLDMIIY